MTKTGRLEKTSVQLDPGSLRDLDHWPGLTRSEAIRLSVERAQYLATLDSEEIAGLASKYGQLLDGALEDLDYEDYRAVARALPAIVRGFIDENPNVSWRDRSNKLDVDPHELVAVLDELHPVGRIGVLDCVVAQRNRRATVRRKTGSSART
jgi:hypothetical protein